MLLLCLHAYYDAKLTIRVKNLAEAEVIEHLSQISVQLTSIIDQGARWSDFLNIASSLDAKLR